MSLLFLPVILRTDVLDYIPGKKVQIKIVNSLGEVLNNDKDIQLKDADNIYTLEQSFLYEGKKMNESINYAHGSPLEPGKYAVEIIEKGKVIAIGDFLLK